MKNEPLIIYYDGSCRFCTRYVSLIHLQKTTPIQLRNARKYPHEIEKLYTSGYNINTGMIITHNGEIFHGSEAILYIQYCIHGYSFLRSVRFRKLRNPLYQFINRSRRILLWSQNKQDILPENSGMH